MTRGKFENLTQEEVIETLREEGYEITPPCKQTKQVALLTESELVNGSGVRLREHIKLTLAKGALQAALTHIQDNLHVESGDQACYFLSEADEDAVMEWLTDYAMSEVNLFTPDEHPMKGEVMANYATNKSLLHANHLVVKRAEILARSAGENPTPEDVGLIADERACDGTFVEA